MLTRVEPIKEWRDDGIRGVVAINICDICESSAIISFGRKIGAVIDDGFGELIAIQIKSLGEEQYLFSISGLREMIEFLIGRDY